MKPMHPNKAPFLGVLTIIDRPSDKSPGGALKHRLIFTRQAAEDALQSLVGMAVNLAADGHHHSHSKIGVIEKATIEGNEILVNGHIWKLDLPDVIDTIAASASEWGMSYELHETHIEDLRAEVWRITRTTFTGASIIPRAQAAYALTDFVLL